VILAAAPAPPDWLAASIWPVLVAQAAIGIIGAIGFFAVIRRFLTVEFPAAMEGVNKQLTSICVEVAEIKEELHKYQIDFVELRERVANLKFRQDLDETRTGNRRPAPR